jgi:hypothetical protein
MGGSKRKIINKRQQRQNKRRHTNPLKAGMVHQIQRGSGVKGWKVNKKGDLIFDWDLFRHHFESPSELNDYMTEAKNNDHSMKGAVKAMKKVLTDIEPRIENTRTAHRGKLQLHYSSHRPSQLRGDYVAYFRHLRNVYIQTITDAVPCTFYVVVFCTFRKLNDHDDVPLWFRSPPYQTIKEKIEEHYDDVVRKFESWVDDRKREKSGLYLYRIESGNIEISQRNFAKGKKYIETSFQGMKKIINIKNNDNFCLIWCIAAKLTPAKNHLNNPRSYRKKFDELMKLVDPADFETGYDNSILYSKYEKLFKVSLYVYDYDLWWDKPEFVPTHISKSDYKQKVHVGKVVDREDVTLFEICHYVLMQDPQKALADQFESHTCFICWDCLFHTRNEEAGRNHKCGVVEIEYKCPAVTDKVTKQFIKPATLSFSNEKNCIEVPVTIYADFEALTLAVLNEQIPISYCFNVVLGSVRKEFAKNPPLTYFEYTGENAAHHFLKTLIEYLDSIYEEHIKRNIGMSLSAEEESEFRSATRCCLCDEETIWERPKYNKNGTRSLADGSKVRHHDHQTGRYIGAAHSKCNLQHVQQKKVTVLFHNLSGYDSHFLAQAFSNKFGEVDVLSNNSQTFKSLRLTRIVPQPIENNDIYDASYTWIYRVDFIDSLAFCKGSLSTLFDNTHSHKYTDTILDQMLAPYCLLEKTLAKKLLTRKGVYPYEWMDSVHKFDLPLFTDGKFLLQPADFKSRLSNVETSLVEQCRFAEGLSRLLQLKTFREYHDIYNRMDVFILTDVFENFRTTCMTAKNCGLDPCHYLGIPSLVFDSYKKTMNDNVELMHVPEEYRQLRAEGMRGGISFWARFLTVANNPSNPNYNPMMPTSYICDEDATSLYPYAARLFLPVGHYEFIEYEPSDYYFQGEGMWELFNDSIWSDHGEGYYFRVDLDLPVSIEDWLYSTPAQYHRFESVIRELYDGNLHDWQANYPILIETKETPTEFLSEEQKSRYTKMGGHNPTPKLITDLRPKRKYFIHYLTLRLAIEIGWVPSKCYGMFKFRQGTPMRGFMDQCARLRGAATTKQEIQLYKDMMNSLVGKTIENVEKYTDFKCFYPPGTPGKRDKMKYYEMTNRLKQGWKMITEDLVIGQVDPVSCKLSKPIPLGIAVYDISKLLMGHLWYFLQSKYGKRIQLCGTDTDSLIFHVVTENWEADKIAMNQESVYPEDHPYYHESRYTPEVTQKLIEDGIDPKLGVFDLKEDYKKKVPGFFNPDMDDVIEVAACRAKMYSARTAKKEIDWVSTEPGKWYEQERIFVDFMKAKGLPKNYVEECKRHEQYLEAVLSGNEQAKEKFSCLRSKDHRIYVQELEKVGLRAVDDKRYSEDCLTSLPFGHYRTV